jgi:hypothetical protein
MGNSGQHEAIVQNLVNLKPDFSGHSPLTDYTSARALPAYLGGVE